MNKTQQEILTVIQTAINTRHTFIQAPYITAFRLLNGFSEGIPDILLDVFGKTLVCHYYGELSTLDEEGKPPAFLQDVFDVTFDALPWLTTCVLKIRKSKDAQLRNGQLVRGDTLDVKIMEHEVQYAIQLTMNRDASFYLDTRNLREWLYKHMQGKTVLNTFAYTGSLGVAALAGGAISVTQLDLSAKFLNVAKTSTSLNGFVPNKSHFQNGDFWSRIQQYKKSGQTFDAVILDPPVYSKTPKGIIDLANNYDRLINKVRPIINHNGVLITINNALYQSGKDHEAALKTLCKDEYLQVEETIPVSMDLIGDKESFYKSLPADPGPYNHPTKISVLRVRKKQ